MLLMIGANAAVVGAAKQGLRIEAQWHLSCLQEVAAGLVVLDVGGDQNSLPSTIKTVLEHVDAGFLKDNFGFCQSQAL